MRRDVFQAISDPTRREIIAIISKKPQNLHQVVDRFDKTRPAIAKHLRILEECGLVQARVQGREKIFSPQLQRLEEISMWLDQYRQFWIARIDALEKYLAQSGDKPSKTKRKKSKN